MAEPPRPQPNTAAIVLPGQQGTAARPAEQTARSGGPKLRNQSQGQDHCAVGATGGLRFRNVIYYVSNRAAGQKVIASWDEHGITFTDLDGVVLREYAWPPKSTR